MAGPLSRALRQGAESGAVAPGGAARRVSVGELDDTIAQPSAYFSKQLVAKMTSPVSEMTRVVDKMIASLDILIFTFGLDRIFCASPRAPRTPSQATPTLIFSFRQGSLP